MDQFDMLSLPVSIYHSPVCYCYTSIKNPRIDIGVTVKDIFRMTTAATARLADFCHSIFDKEAPGVWQSAVSARSSASLHRNAKVIDLVSRLQQMIAWDMPGVDPSPLVVVEGFLGGAGQLIWGNFAEHSNHACKLDGKEDRKIMFVSVGPVSSLHDRACELFYELMGGRVDYGEEHSRLHNHGRYGRTHSSGLYPAWSKDHPLHFLGHSLGGSTIIKLQWLIKTGFFGVHLHPDMILSVNAVSAPFRGTQAVYTLGEDTSCAPAVRPFSVGSALARSVHILSYLAPVLPATLDMHAESRNLSFHDSSTLSLLQQLWHSDWAEGEDATPFDVTFQASDQREANMEGKANPGTFYRSYVASMVDRVDDSAHIPAPSLQHLVSVPPLYVSSQTMASFDFSVLRPRPSFLPLLEADGTDLEKGPPADLPDGRGSDADDAYRANDGVVPFFSQWHPFDCRTIRCKHVKLPLNGDSEGEVSSSASSEGQNLPTVPEEVPQSGVWYVHHVEDASHFSIVPLWLGTSRQKMFWRDLGHWLWTVDAMRVEMPNDDS